MNQLVNGEWRTDTFETTDESGAFDRQTTTFRNWVVGSEIPDHVDAEPDERFEPEPGRYHLYVSYACPWAHRALLARSILGLEDVIDVSVVDPWRGEDGWQFSPEKAGCTPDRVHDSDYLRELYVRADPDVTCRVTVPVLWDTDTDTIVNNESREVLRMLDTAFADLGNGRRLLPEDDEAIERVDEIITAIYEPINNGVYRAGFATSQSAYDAAIDELFDALDHWNEVLADRRFLAGDELTEADLCLFTTLIRFDHVYHTHFMCNVRAIHEYENLWPYLRDLYQLPGVAETVDLDHITEHYYTTHPDVTPTRIIARGPDLDFEAPHDRERLADDPDPVEPVEAE
ncbi:glutathione S-transferase family protein [Halopenitus sp. POP-27]|uniref:glutathione S-transferase family protein n=1 Tax=Halopenitus sp. POP-27 TaxID=2994425 RepID=UPI00246959FA|nr:glutathione S-transferase family protein [Halopenitus sp. POP-27]